MTSLDTHGRDYRYTRGGFPRLQENSGVKIPKAYRRWRERCCTDYRESSKIVIHRSRSRDETRAPIISVIAGFLEGKRAAGGQRTPRANARSMESSQRALPAPLGHTPFVSKIVSTARLLLDTRETFECRFDSSVVELFAIWRNCPRPVSLSTPREILELGEGKNETITAITTVTVGMIEKRPGGRK